MRDPRIGLLILGVGIAPALIKKSKPMARYVGGQLVRFGEYFLHDSEEPSHIASPEAATAEAVAAPPVVEEIVEVIIIEEVPIEIVVEETVEEVYQSAPVAEETPAPGPEPENKIEENPSPSTD